MAEPQLLICSVSAEHDRLVCACTSCGWVSPPATNGTECGSLWDAHRATAHAPVEV